MSGIHEGRNGLGKLLDKLWLFTLIPLTRPFRSFDSDYY